jgi:hypothetical protein
VKAVANSRASFSARSLTAFGAVTGFGDRSPLSTKPFTTGDPCPTPSGTLQELRRLGKDFGFSFFGFLTSFL